MINYAETLRLAEEHGIEALTLEIAYKVNYLMLYNDVDESRFEDYCQAVYNLYFDLEEPETSVYKLVEALFECMQYSHSKDGSVASIDNILAYGEDYHTVKDYYLEFTL